MLRRTSPFKLTTHFRGWSQMIALGLGISVTFNFALIYANIKQSQNLSIPRIIYKTPSGVVLPLASSAFIWTPEVAKDYIKLFLPILYTFTPSGLPEIQNWSPFINPQLLHSAKERYQKNEAQIRSDGLSQTLFVREVSYDMENETAQVLAEVRLIDRNGQLTRTPLKLTIDLIAVSDPLNAYGHSIQNIH